MTNNQQLMSILRNVGENHRAQKLNLLLSFVSVAGAVATVIYVSKYLRSEAKNNLLRKVNHDILARENKTSEAYNALFSDCNEMSKAFDLVQKENVILKNIRISQSNVQEGS